MSTRYPSWYLTGGLALVAAVSVLFAPRLQSPPPEPDYTTEDLCVSVGKWECCYKDGEDRS